MRLYIDSAVTEDWEVWTRRNVLYGATTNPLIFQKQNVDFNRRTVVRMIDKAKDLGLKALQLQVHGLRQPKDAAKRMARYFERWPAGVVAKVPLTAEGLAVLPLLPKDLPITLTAAYDTRQAVLAAAQQARYIAPYYGRLKESGQDADAIVDAMLAVCRGKSRVLVASLRSAEQVVALAVRGHDTFTLSPQVFEAFMDVPQTQAATAEFEAAASMLEKAAGDKAGFFKS
ncbi:MAG: hypothetical protein CME01_04920 [Geminicoccus sp.]|nr:hypothetical protein [Geminicoccus sp.]